MYLTYSGFTRYKMAKIVWRYSDDERGIIESVYKFCERQKGVGNKAVAGLYLGKDCSTHWNF